ncbi:Flavin reductase like domain protein [Vibrio palustris]|uniref:Flavin reductase like domain protein n=2 Tax=Vibrio palustris TaxID=1918946 RepID=A0A1R4B5P6_9VIBR|nr:Flavin reductase like domain protein [Vibrio palustris]
MSQHTHFYEPQNGHGLAHDPFKAIIAPRPIGWISSRSREGVDNLAPYSFFNAFANTPPIIGFASVGWKDSVRNIQETGEFCWNMTTRTLAEKMNQSCAPVPPDVSEFEHSGLTAVESKLVNVARVAEAPVSFECKLTQLIQLQNASEDALDNWLVLGEVVGVHINNTYLKDGVFQTVQAQPVMRAGGPSTYFGISELTEFDLFRPQYPLD